MKNGKNKLGENLRHRGLSTYSDFFKFFSFLVVVSVSLFGSFLPVSGSGEDPVHEVPVLVLKFFPLADPDSGNSDYKF